MLALLFNKKSPLMYTVEFLGLLLAFRLIWRWETLPKTSGILTLLFMGLYLFLRFCATYRWYPAKHYTGGFSRSIYPGIEQQFKKTMVPVVYILAISMAWLTLDGHPAFAYFTIFLLMVVAHVNVILLCFHYKDDSREAVNFLTNPASPTKESEKL